MAAFAGPGAIVFDRFDGVIGAEGVYQGTTILDAAGARPLELPLVTLTASPIWAPDGQRLAVNVWLTETGPAGPAIIGADGGGFVDLVTRELDGLWCTGWSSDGTLLACGLNSTDPDKDGIYTIRPDGSHATRLTHSPFHFVEGKAGNCGGGENRSVFSPDGSTIAFVQQRCGKGANPAADESAAIETVATPGGEVTEVVPQGKVRSHPGGQISWVGDWIAFGSQDGELWKVHADGTELTHIELPSDLGDYQAYGPTLSPDGTRIAFSLYLETLGSTDLYTMAADGSDLVRITDADGAEGLANWGPAPTS